MSITIKKLLEPINRDNLCGEILSEHADFYILKEMINGKEETQWSAYEPPDWKNILRMAKGLLLKGKDIWVIVIFIYALAEIHGINGVINGLEFLKDVLEKFWDDIQPRLGEKTEDDYTLSRLSPIATMSSCSEHLCSSLKKMPLLETIRLGKFSYEDIKILTTETALRSKKLEGIEINSISSDIEENSYKEMVSSIEKCIDLCAKIDAFITEKVGEKHNISKLTDLIKFFKELIAIFGECVKTSQGEIQTVSVAVSEKIDDTKKSVSVNGGEGYSLGEIRNEQDVIKLLNDICRWYEKNNLASPVLFFVEFAKNLIGKKFFGSVANIFQLMEIISSQFKVSEASANSNRSTNSTSEAKKEIKSDNSLPGSGLDRKPDTLRDETTIDFSKMTL